ACAAREELEARRREIYEAHSTGVMNRTHFGVPGALRTATDADIKAAYFRLAKRFHPDSLNDPSLEDVQGRVQVVLTRLGEAYAILGNPVRRAQYEATLPKQFNPPHVTRPPETWRAPLPGDWVRTGARPPRRRLHGERGGRGLRGRRGAAARRAASRRRQVLGRDPGRRGLGRLHVRQAPPEVAAAPGPRLHEEPGLAEEERAAS